MDNDQATQANVRLRAEVEEARKKLDAIFARNQQIDKEDIELLNDPEELAELPELEKLLKAPAYYAHVAYLAVRLPKIPCLCLYR